MRNGQGTLDADAAGNIGVRMYRPMILSQKDLVTFIEKNKKWKLLVIHIYSHSNVRREEVEEMEKRIVEKMSHARNGVLLMLAALTLKHCATHWIDFFNCSKLRRHYRCLLETNHRPIAEELLHSSKEELKDYKNGSDRNVYEKKILLAIDEEKSCLQEVKTMVDSLRNFQGEGMDQLKTVIDSLKKSEEEIMDRLKIAVDCMKKFEEEKISELKCAVDGLKFSEEGSMDRIKEMIDSWKLSEGDRMDELRNMIGFKISEGEGLGKQILILQGLQNDRKENRKVRFQLFYLFKLEEIAASFIENMVEDLSMRLTEGEMERHLAEQSIRQLTESNATLEPPHEEVLEHFEREQFFHQERGTELKAAKTKVERTPQQLEQLQSRLALV
ncbi:unnamed protein product [Darwinula stevensoni]|uniref:Uncharacterized protein n=1 Tax=Darwinula stevensoni TaxID=69355 RepID=A0A7R9A6V8_9CRUS|nr:unnamed protein product [Darwinula stevensoni]CAG0895800.1 unnamed protein product [Darwinula stevensoni]